MTQWKPLLLFGSALGSLGLLVGGVQFFQHSPLVGSVWILAYLIPIVVAVCLWRFRFRLTPYPATQYLFATIGVCWTGALATAIFLRPDLLIRFSTQPTSARGRWMMDVLTQTPALGLIAVVAFPIFMAWFHRQEMRSRSSRSS
jgi:hypothetical protein